MSGNNSNIPGNEFVDNTNDLLSDDDDVMEYDNIDIMMLLNKYESIVCNLYLVYMKYKHEGIMKTIEYNTVIEELENIINKIKNISNLILIASDESNDILGLLQEIKDKISSIMRQHGSPNIEDMLYISCGKQIVENIKQTFGSYFSDVINKYIHPINYKMIPWSTIDENKMKNRNKAKSSLLEDVYIAETSGTLEAHDLTKFSCDSINLKINGLKFVIQNEELQQTMVIQGFVDNIPLNYLRNITLLEKRASILENVPNQEEFHCESFKFYIDCLSLKELLINSPQEIYEIFVGYRNNVRLIKKKSLAKICREFIQGELFDQRQTLLQLLIFSDDFELQFMCYLLYDMLSLDVKATEDSEAQRELYDSLPPILKAKFKDAMKETITYTTKLMNMDIQNNLPLEQRICLLKTNDSVKEKAMMKLKELKAKSEDSGSKARQYLDGLLKIPFNVYREEPILNVLDNLNENFKSFLKSVYYQSELLDIPVKESYSNGEIMNYVRKYCNLYSESQTEIGGTISLSDSSNDNKPSLITNIMNIISKMTSKEIVMVLDTYDGTKYEPVVSVQYYNENYKIEELREVLYDIVNQCIHSSESFQEKLEYLLTLCTQTSSQSKENNELNNKVKTLSLKSCQEINHINNAYSNINKYFGSVKQILDESVYGHEEAKKQVERIIGQWINGQTSGYCFGFEGPPGVGKTSIAKKGLSKCLQDEDGTSRPFAFIAIGGSSNGSTLDGHNYTYVGSMWGKIVDVLMETKCMNPIIFIDEIDKVSRTESGREIISILTHLIDPTQNDTFQDKYFSGIDLDLSKALFIFSYNDVELMDRVLLDRIHRIKFKHLSLEEKITICNNYMLPEIYEKMGQVGNIKMPDDILTFIINYYTCEAGVRKLKEILFEIIGEINLEMLHNMGNIDLPIILTEEMVKDKYLKERNRVKPKLIHSEHSVGTMNGLWANALGKGGIIPIEARFMIADKALDMKLTGSQGDVMKESMSVAKTLSFNLMSQPEKEKLMKILDTTSAKGIHIHCPEGAVPKDGPSAGTAITVTLYSLLTNKRINHKLAITGEMNLQGKVTAIGGLDLKFLGGIEAGVTTFLFPTENQEDFDKFMEKYGNNPIVSGINFHAIETIHEAIKHAIID